MHLVILGEKVAAHIRDKVVPRVDNVDITTFKDANSFSNAANLKTIFCDRLIFTEEAIKSSEIEDKRANLQGLREFMYVAYPTATIVAICNTVQTQSLCEDIFFSDSCISVLFQSKVKPACIIDIVNAEMQKLYELYGSVTRKAKVTGNENSDLDSDFSIDSDFANLDNSNADSTGKKNKLLSAFGKLGGNKGASSKNSSTEIPADIMSDFSGSMQSPQLSSSRNAHKPKGFNTGTKNNDLSTTTSVNTDAFDFESENSGFDDAVTGTNEFDLNDFSQVAEESFEDNETDFNNMLSSINDMEDFNSSDFTSEDFSDPFNSEAAATADFEDNYTTDNNFSENFSVDMDDFDSDFSTPASRPAITPAEGVDLDIADFDIQPSAPVQQLNSVTGLRQSNNTGDVRLKRRTTGANLFEAGNAINVDSNNIDYADLSQRLQSTGKPQIKVVERVVEKVITKEVPARSSTVSRYQNIIGGNINVIYLITGDRRSGVTRTALTITNHFAEHVKTLYVDLDIHRHGSMYYLGLDELVDTDAAVQNGLGLLKSGRDIEKHVFKPAKKKFDALVTMPAAKEEMFKTRELQESLSQLIYQTRAYNVMVIDCPFDSLYLLNDLLFSMETYICIDSDICACSNTVVFLDELSTNYVEKAAGGKQSVFDTILTTAEAKNNDTNCGLSRKSLAALNASAKYIVRVTEAKNEIVENMAYLNTAYSLDDEDFNWTKLNYAGTVDQLESIIINSQG